LIHLDRRRSWPRPCRFSGLAAGIQGVRVVAEAQNGLEAWELICSLRPALALFDISMPLLNGLELTARVAAKQSTTRVVVLSMHASEEFIHRAIRAGVSGYLLKDTCPTDLEQAIRAVDRGETYFHVPAVNHAARSPPVYREKPIRIDSLTSRQREILQLIGEGYSTKVIANLLGISPDISSEVL